MFDYLLEEFSGELSISNQIPRGIEKTDFVLEKKYVLIENLSLSLSPILVEDSASLMEEFDLFLAFDDSMPPGIEDDDYDSEGDIRFLEELLNTNSLLFPKMISRIRVLVYLEKWCGGDISEHDVLMPNLLPTQPTLCPVFDLLLPFSSEKRGQSVQSWTARLSRDVYNICQQSQNQITVALSSMDTEKPKPILDFLELLPPYKTVVNTDNIQVRHGSSSS
ncbi:hypothetical protein Tco_1103983 [Tanacetum coccineum]